MPNPPETVSVETKQLQIKLKVLESKKQMLFQRFQKLFDYIKDLSKPKIAEYFTIGINSLEESKTQLTQVVEEINFVSLEIDPEFSPSYQVVEAADNLHCHIIGASKKLDEAKTASIGVSQQTNNNGNLIKSQPKLPQMDLVEFSGDPKTWPIFYQNFKSCVHDNSELDNTCKIHYLLSKLSGRALTLCSGITPIASNYQTIWKILEDTFQDERLLATTYIRSIMDFKTINTESAKNLNLFLEKFDISVSALKQLSLPSLADFLLVTLALSKLDNNTQRLFEMTLIGNEIPSYDKLVAFIKQQAKILERTSSGTSLSACSSNPSTSKFSSKPKLSYSYCNSSDNRNLPFPCAVCAQPTHSVNKCSKFLKLTPTERYKCAREKFLCLNCLSPKHRISVCKSQNTCNVCKQRHHSLIHFDSNTKNKSHESQSCDSKPDNSEPENSVNHFVSSPSISAHISGESTTLLPTEEVNVTLCNGEIEKIRILLDSGGQDNFISLKCCRRLKIPIDRKNVSVIGIGSCSRPIKGIARKLVISSRFNSELKFKIDALVLENLTTNLPTCSVSLEQFDFLHELPLADPQFHRSAEIDGILGTNLFFALFKGDSIVASQKSPVVVPTSLGYIVTGKALKAPSKNMVMHSSTPNFCCIVDEVPLEKLVGKFLKLEEVPELHHVSPEEIECENQFKSSYSRDSSGRYTVSLPFKIDPVNLSDSLTPALKRFHSLEKKLNMFPEYKAQYSAIFQDYLDQGHMQKLQKLDDNLQNCRSNSPYYVIPHHAIKKDSISTPLRIVLDASAKTIPSSFSLNDCLYTGPKLQVDIVRMLLNFRLFFIVLIGDLCQMYRQIKLSRDDHKFQRILWRFSTDQPIEIYEITRVAFGVRTSPYLALRVIKQLCIDEAQNFPEASKFVLEDMFVDDFISSIDTPEQAKMLITELIELFQSGGFEITKWQTNPEEVLSHIPEKKRLPYDIKFDSCNVTKVLGIQWQCSLDVFSFNVSSPDTSNQAYSKRYILSQISRIFDPLGLLGPVVLYAKLFIRKLWSIKLDWDSNLPTILYNKWVTFERELVLLKQISIPRWLGVTKNSSISLIGFADASQEAYGAVVYLRVETDGIVHINLVCSKSKVSPLKIVSIPRLELSACLLLSKLLNYVQSIYSTRCKIDNILACTDSQIALGWISASPHRWKTFVANRVSKIQFNLPISRWFFVQGEQNIADVISRGVVPSELLKNLNTWLKGPTWLAQNPESWSLQSLKNISLLEDMPEKQTISLFTAVKSEDNTLYSFICKFSSFSKLVRSMVYVLRFAKLLPTSSEIIVTDLEKSEQFLIKLVQSIFFKELLVLLKGNKEVPPMYRRLRPFLDTLGIIRVGGRLINATVGFDFKHPFLLPKKDHFVTILVDHFHRKHLHTGSHLLSSLLRSKYWIISARNIVRQRVRACNFCFKFKPKPEYPLMANLPSPRVTPQVKPFIDTGVDYAGPFSITLSRHRGVRTQKAYVCLFVCLSTKCLHLELASDLSTATFLDALKRFLSRRGPIKTLYSDRGSNFIGTKRHFDELEEFINSSNYSQSLKAKLLEDRIISKFNVALAAHMEGLWESNVKSMKNHLFKAIGSQILTYEEFSTILTQIEALLNSRPLCSYVSNDPSDPCMLTPAHFTLTPLQSFPASDVLDENINRLNRKQLLDRIVQSYWNRWKDEYLHQLQVRSKWNTVSNPVKIGTVVVFMNENTPPLSWPMGIVRETFPGKDGIIRIASVKTEHGLYKRPITKLCPLPTQ